MDPQNRSEVWRVIERTKQQRIVVLTTHSMEEANVLSDVIGIMAAGQLKCFGSASALKRQYGEGFYLHLICNLSARRTVKRVIRTFVPSTLRNIAHMHISSSSSSSSCCCSKISNYYLFY
jgi:ABC-type multidrug transport system ATPase subunit